MSKHTFITMMLSASLFTLIVTDFYHRIPWYIQFGLVILTFIILMIMAIFEKNDTEEEQVKTPKDNKTIKKAWLYVMIPAWLAIIVMNVLVGNPEMKIFNIREPQFWIFVVALPLLSKFNFKKSTDGV